MSGSRLDKLTAAFVAQLPRRRDAIGARLAAGDWGALRSLIREVGDAALTYGLFDLSDACAGCADALFRTGVPAGFQELVDDLNRAIEATTAGGACDELAG